MEGFNAFEAPTLATQINTTEQGNLHKKAEVVTEIDSMGGIEALRKAIEAFPHERLEELGDPRGVIAFIDRGEDAVEKGRALKLAA